MNQSSESLDKIYWMHYHIKTGQLFMLQQLEEPELGDQWTMTDEYTQVSGNYHCMLLCMGTNHVSAQVESPITVNNY